MEWGILLRVKGHHSPMAAAVRRSMAVVAARAPKRPSSSRNNGVLSVMVAEERGTQAAVSAWSAGGQQADGARRKERQARGTVTK